MIYMVDRCDAYFRTMEELELYRAEMAPSTAGTEDEISDDEIHVVEPYYPAEG